MYRKNIGRRVVLLPVAIFAGGVFADARYSTRHHFYQSGTWSTKNALERDR